MKKVALVLKWTGKTVSTSVGTLCALALVIDAVCCVCSNKFRWFECINIGPIQYLLCVELPLAVFVASLWFMKIAGDDQVVIHLRRRGQIYVEVIE
ncbi:MAG: hypothetical protein WCO65_02265 [bacterium]